MATAKNNKALQSAGPADKGLKVYGKREGFRRAGFVFGAEPRTLALADITPEQEKALRDEPALVCVDVDIPQAEPSAT